MPAALRLLARLLQPPHRALQLRPRVPGKELPGALPGGEIRVSVCAQVSRGKIDGGVSVPLAGWGDMLGRGRFEQPRLGAALASPLKK